MSDVSPSGTRTWRAKLPVILDEVIAAGSQAVRARLEDLGAEALEDLLILAESEKDFLELELFGSEATAAGSRGPTALWAEVVKARAAEESWLRAQAELRVQQRKAAEAERRVRAVTSCLVRWPRSERA
eukprot:COSAG01_NODE_5097_length_4490_cov_17.038488_2_plen_129_part_00